MEEEYKNYPFYDWVPKPLGIIFMIILFVPMITMSGVYSANSGEMMSGLGIQSEYIAFAGFCTSIGMAAFSPFFYELVCIRREKMMCIVGFSILFILSFVCAQTDSLFILGLCSLLMGFVRQTLLMAHLFVLIRYGFGIELRGISRRDASLLLRKHGMRQIRRRWCRSRSSISSS